MVIFASFYQFNKCLSGSKVALGSSHRCSGSPLLRHRVLTIMERCLFLNSSILYRSPWRILLVSSCVDFIPFLQYSKEKQKWWPHPISSLSKTLLGVVERWPSPWLRELTVWIRRSTWLDKSEIKSEVSLQEGKRISILEAHRAFGKTSPLKSTESPVFFS